MSPAKPPSNLHQAYQRMITRAHEFIQTGNKKLDQALEHAADYAQKIGEISREEAERLSQQVSRDLKDLGHHLDQSDNDLRTWLHMDVELIEASIRDLLFSVADKTRLELTEFARNEGQTAHWHTGEMTAPGVLECTECEKQLHFTRISHIPPALTAITVISAAYAQLNHKR